MNTPSPLTADQQRLVDVWQSHVYAEFGSRRVEDALETMTADAYVNHVPLLCGAVGKQAVGDFYSRYLVGQMPPDVQSTLVSRTIGQDRLVEESVFRFTHSLRMDWFLPGLEPTGKLIEVAVVGVVQFRGDKIAHEHLYWDQASVLVQIGLLDESRWPVQGAQVAPPSGQHHTDEPALASRMPVVRARHRLRSATRGRECNAGRRRPAGPARFALPSSPGTFSPSIRRLRTYTC